MDFLRRTWAEIDLSALIHNLKIIKSLATESKIMAVVKADAYGHSVCDVAPILQENGADFFAVSNLDEALKLRKCGINRPILILGYTPAEKVKELFENDFSQCVYSKEYAEILSQNATKNHLKIKIHIKIDTGMSRLGFDCRSHSLSEVNDAIYSAKLQNLELEGIFTHFAVSDRSSINDDGLTDEQYERFSLCLKRFSDSGIIPTYKHCCNSAGLIADSDKHLDICRPGIILYGLSPSDAPEFQKGFIPVMTFKSVISMVKEISKGDTVSYGRTFTADKKIKVATVSAGYADGYPRLLSNKGYVLINGQKANIIGRICMDQFSVDVSNISSVKVGDEVILFGKDLSVDVLAKLCGTINYEIVCGISNRVPRIVKGI